MRNFVEKSFNLYQGFKDYEKEEILEGDNEYYCNIYQSLQNAKKCNKICYPPPYLFINIDYGKYKKFQPEKVDFGHEIDLKMFLFSQSESSIYELIGICTHLGYTGRSGHYVAKCKRKDNKWFVFNDSSCYECNDKEIYNDSPYLLLYKRKDVKS